MRKKIFHLIPLALAIAFCWSAIPAARVLADNTATCVARMSSYVTELDQLLAQTTWLAPFEKLNSRYFPFRDCDTDPLLVETTKSQFYRGVTYYPRSKRYVVQFASKRLEVSFAYRADERRSENHNVALVD
jgi:hypothetical protein